MEELVETAGEDRERRESLGPDETGYDLDAFAAMIEAMEDALTTEIKAVIRADVDRPNRDRRPRSLYTA